MGSQAQSFFVVGATSVMLRSQSSKTSRMCSTSSPAVKGCPVTLEIDLASTRNSARISLLSWPMFISGTTTVEYRDKTSPRLAGNGWRCRR